MIAEGNMSKSTDTDTDLFTGAAPSVVVVFKGEQCG